MTPTRLNALTDGVIAIVLTIMVLDLRAPQDSSIQAIVDVLPLLAAYVLAFINVAIYWNNHHHMMQSATRVTGTVLWANCALLFWLSLVPLAIRWIDETGISGWPVASFALILTFCTMSYQWLEWSLMRAEGQESRVRHALGSRRKERISFAMLLAAVLIAFKAPVFSVAILVTVSIGWLIPDRRFDRALSAGEGA